MLEYSCIDRTHYYAIPCGALAPLFILGGNMENNPLEKIILESTVPEKDKELFLELANKFYEGFDENLFLTSIDLSKKYRGTNPNEWMIWLEIPGIKKYVNKFIKEQISYRTNMMLSVGDAKGGAVQVRKLLDSSETDDMSNFVVLRLPDREDKKYEE